MTDAVAERPAGTRVRQKPVQAPGVQTRTVSQSPSDFSTELLQFESEVRSIRHERELYYHLCNSTRQVIPYEQCFYGTVTGAGQFKLQTASSISIVDRNAPFNRWIEKTIAAVIRQNDTGRQVRFRLPEYCDGTDEETSTYPFADFLWTPQIHNGQLIGGTLMTREFPWRDSDCALVNRLSDLYLHAASAIKGQKTLVRKRTSAKPVFAALCLGLVALGFLPVSITALAPVEVLPSEPFVLAAPFDGVVKEITASQGQSLSAGDTVIVFDDVHLLNEKKLAEQRAGIAAARYQRASQGAIADHRVKREIEVAKAEFELAKAESRYATELLEQARVTAPVPGIAIFSDKSDWEGKPVSAGEAIVSVADPALVELAVDLPVKESMVLSDGARIKVFLDSDPMNPLEATLVKASYRAQPDKRDILSYSLRAELADNDAELPRIGVQGTAQVFSEKASLAYVLFRRPITAFRQYTGW
jgi:biotin carboxyl carrier protein